MERKDGENIFAEGEAFSGIERLGNAEACITPVPSPHIQPELSKDRLKNAAEGVLGREVEFTPGLDAVDTISAQLLIWWREANRDANQDGQADMLHISTLPPDQQASFASVIAKQTEKAVNIVTNASGKPTIWGSWGYGSPEERLLTGRSRGVPTNKHGHLHVIDFGSTAQESPRDPNLSAAEKLNHYAPWGSLLHKEFGEPIARTIKETVVRKTDAGVNVEPFTELVQNDGNASARRVNEGYQITFEKDAPIAKILEGLTEIAGKFEMLYQNATKHHEYYHKNFSQDGVTESARALLIQDARNAGFHENEAEKFSNFTLAIRPTYAQLSKWQEELNRNPGEHEVELERIAKLKELYEHVRRLLEEDPERDSFSSALIRDTVAKPEDYRSIGRTWAEHASATYIIDGYNVTNNGIMVSGLQLLPGIDSTQAAPEQVIGRILRRSTGN